MTNNRLTYLLEKRISEALNPLEWEELKDLAHQTDPEIFQNLVASQLSHFDGAVAELSSEEARLGVMGIVSLDKKQPATPTSDLNSAANLSDYAPVYRVHFLKTAWFRYAAVLLLLAGTAAFLYNTYQNPRREIVQHPSKQSTDIQPGSNKAILTLADGTDILLDSVGNGAFAQQGNTQILKLDGGKLAYHGADGGEVLYNTISTPKGGQYQIALPDGSQVWLNAASSIRFPTTFAKERTVEITGESYFEVLTDKSKPFFVKTGSVTIQVVGTGFNVNAYAEEGGVKVSLSHGSVKVGETILKQGEALKNGKVTNTDLLQDLAWKNGLFDFRGQGVAEVMRQLERWYAIEVVYQGAIPDVRFAGKSSKGVSLNGMLKGLQETGVHCTLNGRRLIVMP